MTFHYSALWSVNCAVCTSASGVCIVVFVHLRKIPHRPSQFCLQATSKVSMTGMTNIRCGFGVTSSGMTFKTTIKSVQQGCYVDIAIITEERTYRQTHTNDHSYEHKTFYLTVNRLRSSVGLELQQAVAYNHFQEAHWFSWKAHSKLGLQAVTAAVHRAPKNIYGPRTRNSSI